MPIRRNKTPMLTETLCNAICQGGGVPLPREGYTAVPLSAQRANPAVGLYQRAGFTVAEATDGMHVMVKRLLPL